jgi:amidophosphoribosyltransferase
MEEIFGKINHRLADVQKNKPQKAEDVEWLKKNVPLYASCFLGHVRYGTYGKNATEFCHPLLRQNNWLTKNLVIAGNFNLTNVDELFQKLIDLGQHPSEKTDTVTILEKIGHFPWISKMKSCLINTKTPGIPIRKYPR